eukprot:360742-Chlamydomonas_euryale.AAC.3
MGYLLRINEYASSTGIPRLNETTVVSIAGTGAGRVARRVARRSRAPCRWPQARVARPVARPSPEARPVARPPRDGRQKRDRPRLRPGPLAPNPR